MVTVLFADDEKAGISPITRIAARRIVIALLVDFIWYLLYNIVCPRKL